MIKLAIIGTGIRGCDQAENFDRIPGVKVVACCDVDKKKVAQFAKTYNIQSVYTDYKELLKTEELDAVSVVTYDITHTPISIAAMKKGLHVLCEKPLATTAADAWKMVRAAKKYKVINMIDFAYRTASALHKAKEIVASGRIGKVTHIEASHLQSWLSSKIWGDWKKGNDWLWRLSTACGSNGALGDIGCHILDFTTYVVGDISRTCCQLKTFDKAGKNGVYRGYKLDANDSAILNVEFANGAVGSVHVSRIASGHADSVSLRVFGTKGGLEISLDDAWDKLRVSMGTDLDKCKWKTVSCGKCVKMYDRFIKSIRTGKNDNPTFEDGAKVQTYLEKSFKSAKLKKPVKI